MADLLSTVNPPGESQGTSPAELPPIAEEAATYRVADAHDDDMASFDDFDWATDDSVLLGEQLSVAVYRNRAGGVVIRRERTAFEDADNVVVLRDDVAIRILITALQKELKGAGR